MQEERAGREGKEKQEARVDERRSEVSEVQGSEATSSRESRRAKGDGLTAGRVPTSRILSNVDWTLRVFERS